MPLRSAALPPIASGLFLVSGAAALVYQVIWFRRLAHAFGNSSLAMTAVLAGFLLGLGLGAWAFGRLADRLRRPLLGYGVLEVAIALYALAFAPILGWVEGALRFTYPALEGAPLAQAVTRLLAAFLVLAPPCACMGATLPMLVRALAGPLRGLGVSTSWMYAANTLGAALGCYLAGFHLLPALGLERTLHLVVGVNLAVAFAAIALGRRAFQREPDEIAPAAAPVTLAVHAYPAVPPRALELAALASGAAALALQLAWARQLALVLGGTTYAFSAMLFVVLLGIGFGSLAAPALLVRGRDPLPPILWTTALIAATALLGQAALPALAEWVGAVRDMRGSHLGNAVVCVATSGVLELLPSFGAGVLFPLLVEATGAAHGHAGRAVGRVYAWNTLGTTLGAVVAHLWLVPRLGTEGTVLAAIALYLALAVLMALGRAPRTRIVVAAGATLAALLAFVAAPRNEPVELERGLYIYGSRARDVLAGAEVLFHRAGSSANVLVTGHGPHRSLRVNGKVDASTFDSDQRTQLGTAYLPRFLHPGAREVLVIGHGSGATAGASLLFPDTRVTSVEIEPAVVEASRLFDRINHSPERSPGFRMRVEDGRAHLAGTRERYDLVITEPSNPWIAGIANLFTREFYELARERLEPGGVLGQWIQTYALSAEEYVSVVATVLDVFEHAALLRLTTGDTMLLASDRELVPNAASVAHAQALVDAQSLVRADLLSTFGTADVRSLLAQHLVLSDSGVRALVATTPKAAVLTDSNLRLEFDAPRRLFQTPEEDPGATLETALLAQLDTAAYGELLDAIGAGPAQVDGVVGFASLLRRRGLETSAREVLEHALRIDPEHRFALAGLLALAPEVAFEERAAKLVRVDAPAAHAAAIDLARNDQAAAALRIVELLLADAPASATLERTHGEVLERLGRTEEAAAAWARARELDPLLDVPIPTD